MSNKHWYCVNQTGVATLCVDRQDAEATARDGDKLWPQHAPHYVAKIERVKQTPLAQRKIQSIVDSGEYRVIENATVLVNENGHAAIVNHGGAFYWVDNEALVREFNGAGVGADSDHTADMRKKVPEGWQLVPIEPTYDMTENAHNCDSYFEVRDIYKAMLTAAPKYTGEK